jgi:hypothetical protein
MAWSEQWRDNWGTVSPAGAVRVELGRSTAEGRDAARTARDLPAGTPIVVCAGGLGAMRRCRRFASNAGIELDRVYLAFPSVRSPAYLVEAAPAPVHFFVETVLVTPPRMRCAALLEACLAGVRALSPQRLIRALAPGRVAVGTRI